MALQVIWYFPHSQASCRVYIFTAPIQEGKLDLNGAASHTFPIDRAQEAFDFADTHDPSIRKIVFTF